MLAVVPSPAFSLPSLEVLTRAFASDLMFDFGLALGLLSVSSVLCLPYFIARLPVDHFARRGATHPVSLGQRLLRYARNAFGFLLILAGIAMLVLPGQGLLTILVGMVCLDLPWTRRLERRLLSIPSVTRAINKLRTRAGRPPFDFERPPANGD